MKPVALQTYTLRDAFEKDFLGTLKAVAEIGYKGVEVGGTYGREPQGLAQAVADLGMAITSNHAALPTADTLAQTLDFQSAVGSTRLGTGFGPDDLKTVDGCKACAQKQSSYHPQEKTSCRVHYRHQRNCNKSLKRSNRNIDLTANQKYRKTYSRYQWERYLTQKIGYVSYCWKVPGAYAEKNKDHSE